MAVDMGSNNTGPNNTGPSTGDGRTAARSGAIEPAMALAVVVAAAWVAMLAGPNGMGSRVAPFVGVWTVMMAAMMLPSVAPLVLLHRRAASASATVLLVAGYLGVWGVVGLAAYVLPMGGSASGAAAMGDMVDPAMADGSGLAGAGVLATAGVYQLTPLKTACLRRCRTPADFLVQRWHRHAFVLGGEHGLWCLGCCWALMVVLVVAGTMGLAWVVALTGVIAVEKILPAGDHLTRITGLALLALAVREILR